MKKQIVLGLGLAVMAAPALASKARLQALGEDTNGSFYINDNRNIFLNAAQLNNHKNLVTFETGNATNNGLLNSQDSAAAARPEGGVFFNQGNLSYGVQLNNASNTSNLLRASAGASNEQNNVDAFVAGDAGVKWGANLTYGNTTESATINNDKLLRTRLGVIAGDLEGFANISLMNKSEMQSGKNFNGKQGYQIGGAYNLNAYKVFAEYRSIKAEEKSASADASIGLWRVGAGRTDKLNDKATLFTKLEVNRTTLNADAGFSGVSTGGKDQITTNVPLIVGLEHDAASWLTLRGSVSQSLYSTVALKSASTTNLQNTTVVNAGATLKFGEMSVDGVIGNTDATSAIIAGGAGTTGSLRTDNIMSRVSMTYRF